MKKPSTSHQPSQHALRQHLEPLEILQEPTIPDHKHHRPHQELALGELFLGDHNPLPPRSDFKQARGGSFFEEKSHSLIEDDNLSHAQCFVKVIKVAVPQMISMFFSIFIQLINTYYVGRYIESSAIMAGFGMGNMLMNVFCFAVVQGLNGALETLVSQAFGHESYHQCGILLNRGRLISTIILIPIFVFLNFSDRALVAIGINYEIAEISRSYILNMIPGIWAMTQFDAIRKFMVAQGQNNYSVYIQFITLALHFINCYIFIVCLELGMLGAALSTNITFLLNMGLGDFILARSPAFTLTRMPLLHTGRALLQNWDTYLRIGVPGACMVCFEWWAFELLAIFSAYMGVANLAAEVVVINLVSFLFMMPLGISFAASSLTGNCIGRRNIKLAKRFASMSLLFTIIQTSFVCLIICLFKYQLARIFSRDPKVVEIVESIQWIITIYVFFDAIHGVQAGIIRGIGRQSAGSIFTMVCYYLFGLPLALYCGFKLELGIGGLWIGFTIASVLLDVGFYVIIQTADWNKIAQKTFERLEREEAQSERLLKGEAKAALH